MYMLTTLLLQAAPEAQAPGAGGSGAFWIMIFAMFANPDATTAAALIAPRCCRFMRRNSSRTDI